jgi:hypothetical protein
MSLASPGTSRIVLAPRNCKEAYAYWEVPEEHKIALRRQGGEKLILRIYDATNLDLDEQPPHATQEYECSELDRDLHVPIPVDDRDYVAELGYKAGDGSWYSLARSLHTHIPACPQIVDPREARAEIGTATMGNFVETGRERASELFESGRDALGNLFDTARDRVDEVRPGDALKSGGSAVAAGGAAIAAGLGAAAGGIRSFFDADTEDRGLQDRISLRRHSSEEALVAWKIGDAEKTAIRHSGGRRLALRVYDLTDTNLDGQPDSVWEYDCEEFETEKIVRIYSGERDYVAELGYITEEGRWLPLAKSNVLKVE